MRHEDRPPVSDGQAATAPGSTDPPTGIGARPVDQPYRELFDAHPVPMAVCDARDWRILDANEAALRQYGYKRDEFLGLGFHDLVRSDSGINRAGGVTSTGGASILQEHRRKNGSLVVVEVATHPLEYAGSPAVVVMATDVSERRRLEEQLRDALRMEAIGRLAGGIAHDFNNLLTVINGYSQLLLDSLAPTDPRHEDAAQIHLAGERAATLTSQLLAFARRGDLNYEMIDAHVVIGAVAPMLRRLMGPQVELRVELRAARPRVVADPARLEQVLVNLCVNARDAMPDGGRLTIRSADLDLAAPRRFGGELARAGGYLELRVRDTGSGMDEATRRRVFEPFFTTKAGHGTGLGLAMAYGTIQQSGGHLRVTSTEGRGTTFVVLLPRPTEPVHGVVEDH